MKQPQNHLSLKEKLSYGFGDLASVLYWQTFMLYFTFFYTDVFLIPAGVAATLFLVSRIFDGLNDTVVGMIADRTTTKWGKFRPFILWFCLPFVVTGVLVFTVPDFSLDGKIIWAYVTFNLIMVLYTIINIPYTALLGVITPNSKERTSVSSIKFIFAFSAGILISATLLPMTQQLGKGDDSVITAQVSNNTLVVNHNKNGVSNITVQATDAHNNIVSQNIAITVVPKESNIPFVENELSDIFLPLQYKDTSIAISQVFKGNISNQFEFAVENTNTGLITAAIKNSQLVLSPGKESQEGFANITVSAQDKKWGDISESFYVYVSHDFTKLPIVIDSTTDKTLTQGFKKQSIPLSSIFANAKNLMFDVTSTNQEVLQVAILNNNIEIVEGNPGKTTITISGVNGNKERVEKQFTYIVKSNSNNAPLLIANNTAFTIREDDKPLEIDLNTIFKDAEGDTMKYSLEIVNEAKGWSRFFMIIGGLALVFFLITFFGTKERVKPPKAQKSNIKQDLKELFTNKPWLILLATTITFILFVAVKGSVTVHYFKYIIGTQNISLPFIGEGIYDYNVLASVFNTVGQVSSLVGVIAVNYFAMKFGKKKVFVAFFVIAIFSTAIVYILSASQLGLIFFFQFLGSFTGGPLSVLLWAMYADTADYAEWKNGRRATGLIFSASTMSQKIGWAFGAYIALTLMSQMGFQVGQSQTYESVQALVTLFTLIPAAVGCISLVIIFAYPLTDKRVDTIEKELQERRALLGESVEE